MRINSHSPRTALGTALNYLSRRQLTEDQLLKKLKQKEFSSEQISEALAKLKEWQYLDDRTYAASYCRNKRDRYSKSRIRMELKKAGVEEEVISSVFEELYSREKEYINCLEIARKYLPLERQKWEKRAAKDGKKKVYPLDIYIKKKIGEKLFQKGFSTDIIQGVLEEMSKYLSKEDN